MGINPSSVWAAVGAGIGMGTLHVVTGADHVSAVASLAVGNTSATAFWLGARWGCGHSVGLLIVFLTLLALRVETNETVMSIANRMMGISVGLFMVALGAYGVFSVDQRLRDAATIHRVDDEKDEKTRLTSTDANDEPKRTTLNSQIAIAVGIVHGAAGPGAVLGVLPAIALRDEPLVFGYFGGFVVAIVFAMGVFAAAWGWATRLLGEKGGVKVQRGLALFSSALCIVVGVVWTSLAVAGTKLG
jgi:hypothetical protein